MILRAQFALSLVLLATLCLVFAGVVWAARHTPVIADHIAREQAQQRTENLVFLYDNGYVDDSDYVLVDLLQHDDHSRGGVYFIGDSQSRAAIMPWLLPAAEQRLIHNYSLGDLRHRDQRFFFRTLIEEFGLLEAGAENVTIFMGVSFYMARDKDYSEESYVSAVFKRHGFYTYDAEAGVHRVAMSPLERFVRLQRVQANRFLRILFLSPSRVKPFDPETQNPQAEAQGENWRAAMDAELREFEALLDDLQARNVRLRVIMRPNGSWVDAHPYERTYRALVEPMLAARHIPLIDQTDLLADAEFGDAEHARSSGQMRLHEIDRQLAHEALAEMGIGAE